MLNKEDEEPYHLSPPVRRHLEHGQIVVVQYPLKVRMRGKPHFELEEGL